MTEDQDVRSCHLRVRVCMCGSIFIYRERDGEGEGGGEIKEGVCVRRTLI